MRPGISSPAVKVAHWHDTPVYLLPKETLQGPWGLIYSYLARIHQSLKIADKIWAQQPLDLIQVRNEFLSSFVGWWLKQKWGVPLVYQLSFPPDAFFLQSKGASLKSRIRLKIAMSKNRALLRWVLKRADLVLAISDQMRKELIAQGYPEKKIISFPLGVDGTISPENYDGRQVRQKLELDGCPTVIYFGNMERLRRLEFLLEVMARVVAEIPEAKLLMVGGAPDDDYQWLINESNRIGLKEAVRFVGAVPRAAIPFYLAAADISVAPYPPTSIDISRSPTKVLESLGMAVPVIANREIPDQYNLITESGGGICVPYETHAFAEAIVRLLKDPVKAQEAGRQGRKYVLAQRSYDKLAGIIEEQYCRLLSNYSHKN